jgi:hypothetical protein
MRIHRGSIILFEHSQMVAVNFYQLILETDDVVVIRSPSDVGA